MPWLKICSFWHPPGLLISFLHFVIVVVLLSFKQAIYIIHVKELRRFLDRYVIASLPKVTVGCVGYLACFVMQVHWCWGRFLEMLRRFSQRRTESSTGARKVGINWFCLVQKAGVAVSSFLSPILIASVFRVNWAYWGGQLLCVVGCLGFYLPPLKHIQSYECYFPVMLGVWFLTCSAQEHTILEHYLASVLNYVPPRAQTSHTACSGNLTTFFLGLSHHVASSTTIRFQDCGPHFPWHAV